MYHCVCCRFFNYPGHPSNPSMIPSSSHASSSQPFIPNSPPSQAAITNYIQYQELANAKSPILELQNFGKHLDHH